MTKAEAVEKIQQFLERLSNEQVNGVLTFTLFLQNGGIRDSKVNVETKLN